VQKGVAAFRGAGGPSGCWGVCGGRTSGGPALPRHAPSPLRCRAAASPPAPASPPAAPNSSNPQTPDPWGRPTPHRSCTVPATTR
jgi:hypothetical protein